MAESKERTRFLGVRVPDSLHRKLTAALRLEGKTWQEVALKWVEDYAEKFWSKEGRKR